jgi:hypothetical protein
LPASSQIYPGISHIKCKEFEPLDAITLHLFSQKKLKIIVWYSLYIYSASPEGKVRQNWTTFSSPGFGIANFSFLAGKTSYLLITKLGLLTIKMLVLPRLSNFVQFHWTPIAFRNTRFSCGDVVAS